MNRSLALACLLLLALPARGNEAFIRDAFESRYGVKTTQVTRTAYVPSFEVVHHGGGASRKGMRHVGHFMKGGWRYYRKHGWKWL